MKNLKIFSIALAALMLGACSNDEVVQDGGSDPVWNSDGKGYVSFSIQLPTQPNTRAWDDGKHFDDGTPDEYKVNNATLILFTGADGVEKVHSAYELHPNFSPKDPSTDQITTTAKITQEINKIDKTTPIKALVVLNHNDLFKVADGGDLQVSGESYEGKTLEDLNQGLKALKTDFSWHKAGLLMSNAVMADKQGGTVDPSEAKIVGPLVTIDGDKIRPTRAEADANPAATIYVERAEAKVTVTAKKEGTTTASHMPFEIVGWVLDNTSKKNYLTRHTEGFDTWKKYTSTLFADKAKDYRMVGNNVIADGLYRLYWAVDPNYNNVGKDLLAREAEYSTVGGAHSTIDGDMLKADGVAAGYCFENTTDLAHMIEMHLTRVIVKAKFNNGKPFYIIDGNAENTSSFMNEDAVKKEVMARMFTNPEFAKWAKDNVVEGKTLNSATDFDVTLSDQAAGVRTVESIALNDAGKEKVNKGAAETMPGKDIANTLISLSYYADGMAYYPVYIAHFGQGQTPWSVSDFDDAKIYGGNDNNYLGRYGVVRNNWYDISVNSIKALGSPNVEIVTDEEVDKKESYISVKINVLSWAKRTQSVDL